MFLKIRMIRGSFAGAAVLALLAICSVGLPASTYGAESKISQRSIDSLTAIGTAMSEISATVKPAIVNISTTRTVKVPGGADPFADDPFFRRFFGDQLRAQPRERKLASLGSGVIVSANGYIITNYHVVKDADEIKVLLSDQREFVGKVIGSDPKTEISIVKIDASGLPTLPWGDSDALEVGDLVLAVGNPYGLNQTVTMGIVSAVGRANVGIADYEDFIQTDAAINPGNSGGGLVNVRGELVGINTAIFSTSGGYQGIGFAIPSNMVRTIMGSLLKSGKVIRGWLGVSVQRITSDLAKQFDLKDESGVLVSDVSENGPAGKAGLMRGDVILEYDGKKTDDPSQFRNMIANTLPGESHHLTVMRNNRVLTLNVAIGELPQETQEVGGEEDKNVLKGVEVQEITPELAARLDLPEQVTGVMVSDINEDSPAYGVLASGDVIQEINRSRITGVKDYERAMAETGKNDSLLLLVYRGGSSLFITLSRK
ncbi:MAG: DegQ family serine endoprotease [Nitrospiraceae bacterium]|nr:DegQ family serine endoprotease [Nitrospiraceae bacterium]